MAILIRMETVAAKSNWPAATVDATKNGLGILIALFLFAAVREALVSGTFFANWQLLLPASNEIATAASNLDDTRLFQFANTQAGAFILLGMLIALFNSLTQTTNSAAAAEAEEVVPAKRARVTGRLSKE